VKQLLGVYVVHCSITTLTYFLLTWFPVYLVRERGFSILNAGFIAAVPTICGFAGDVLSGPISGWLLRRGRSLTVAHKTPIVIGYLVKGTGWFSAALVFVAANARVAVCRYRSVVGEIKRVVPVRT
jgi:ACS family glucarate transporter-like MFS transporter